MKKQLLFAIAIASSISLTSCTQDAAKSDKNIAFTEGYNQGYNAALDKLKEQGILDENGKPIPQQSQEQYNITYVEGYTAALDELRKLGLLDAENNVIPNQSVEQYKDAFNKGYASAIEQLVKSGVLDENNKVIPHQSQEQYKDAYKDGFNAALEQLRGQNILDENNNVIPQQSQEQFESAYNKGFEACLEQLRKQGILDENNNVIYPDKDSNQDPNNKPDLKPDLKPDAPINPNEPVVPDKPIGPIIPDIPDIEPDIPDIPDSPVIPLPEPKPEPEPEEPVIPNKPVEPSNPDSEQHVTPEEPVEPKPVDPKPVEYKDAIEVYKASIEKMNSLNYQVSGYGVSTNDKSSDPLYIYETLQHGQNELYFEKISNGNPVMGMVGVSFAQKAYINGNNGRRASSETKNPWKVQNNYPKVTNYGNLRNSSKDDILKEFGMLDNSYLNYIIDYDTVKPECLKIKRNSKGSYQLVFDLVIDNGINSKSINGYKEQVKTMSGKDLKNVYSIKITLTLDKDLKVIQFKTSENYQVSTMNTKIQNELTYKFTYNDIKVTKF